MPKSFEIVGWHDYPTGMCLGEAWAQLPSGMIVRHLPIFKNNSKTWLGLASRPVLDRTGRALVLKPNGKPQWEPVVTFVDAATRLRFAERVFEALLKAHPEALDRDEQS